MRTFVLSFDPGIAAAGLQADCESPEKADEQIHQGGADGGRELEDTACYARKGAGTARRTSTAGWA